MREDLTRCSLSVDLGGFFLLPVRPLLLHFSAFLAGFPARTKPESYRISTSSKCCYVRILVSKARKMCHVCMRDVELLQMSRSNRAFLLRETVSCRFGNPEEIPDRPLRDRSASPVSLEFEAESEVQHG